MWPVFFGVGDSLIRFLMGDLSAGDYVFATGPQQGDTATWQGDLPISAIGPEQSLIGLALHYTEGGARDDDAQTRYQELAAWTRAGLLSLAARSFGLSPLLAAFGASGDDENEAFARPQLLQGLDPDVERERLDSGLREGVSAFMPTADALRPFRGGTAATLSNAGGAAPSSPDRPDRGAGPGLGPVTLPRVADIARRLSERAPRVSRPPIVDRLIPDRLIPDRFFPAPSGTVAAAILQAWPIREVDGGDALVVSRPLQSRSVQRLSLVMRTTIRREG
jgi:hypothetical protein